MEIEKQKNQVLAEAEKKEAQPKRWRRFFLMSLILLIIVVVWLIYLYLQRPGQGVILESKSETAAGETKTYGTKRFEGEYVSFEISSAYEVKTHDVASDINQVFLESAFFSEDPSLAKKIALTVENLKGRTLKDSANYNLRKGNPKRFQEEKFDWEGIHGVAFMDKDSDLFEKTIFISEENYLAEISLTALKPASDDLDKELDEIAGSLVWQK
jgi:hypothetical protein